MRLRPVDLAREHGISTQVIRKYEDEGIIPAAARTEHGYRIYGTRHRRALRAFVALAPGHGRQRAGEILGALNGGDLGTALALIDRTHAELVRERETVAAVERALRELAGADAPAPRPDGGILIGHLAHQLGVKAATLRKWERAGVLRPRRHRGTGYRIYSGDDVRDAHMAQQLRRGGFLLRQIAPVIDQVRNAGSLEALDATLHDWRTRLTDRGRALLAGAAALDAYLTGEDGEPG